MRGIITIACLLVAITSFAQYPVDVQVQVAPPYPIRLSDFTSIESNILITLNNTNQSPLNIALIGTLENEESGATISSDPSRLRGVCTTLPPGLTMLSGTELRALFDPDYLVYRGVSRDQIRGDEALPEGLYKLCIRAVDCNNPTSFLSDVPMTGAGCSPFQVTYQDPPIIISPVCQDVANTDMNQINIAWTQVMPSLPAQIDYSIRIVEVEPITRNPFDAMQSAPAVFAQDVSGTTFFNLMVPEDALLELGRKYAIQIQAKTEDGSVAFRNQGKSEICTFMWGNPTAATGGFDALAIYPADGDIIPFTFFPFVIKYQPYDNSYRNFHSEFKLMTPSGTDDTHTRDLGWSGGPLRAQENATHLSLTQDDAQHIAVYKNQTETSRTFDKTKPYTWFADIELQRNSQTLRSSTPRTDFRVGMGASILNLPANADTVAPGDILFRWHTGPEPRQLFPEPRHIVQASGGSDPTFFNGWVNERWVVEVSKTEDFAVVIKTMSGNLSQTVDLNSDEQVVKDALYKDLDETFNITEVGKYYWRVRWMLNPEVISDLTSYVSSPIWSFVISNDAPAETVAHNDEETPPGACVSACLAEPITNRTAAGGLTVGSTLTVGKFTMTIRTITNSSSNRFTGEGYVTVPFLNNIRILVDYTSIQFNSDRKVFAGTVEAKDDRAFVTEEIPTRAGRVLGLSETEAQNLAGFLADGERLMSAFTGSREIGMPIGIDREIDGHRYTIGVINMTFATDKATVDAVMSLDIPDLGSRLISLGVADLCITPGGLGDEGRLYLPRDFVVVQEGETQFAFKGAEAADTTQSTYVSWDCRGFKCMQIRGQVTFPRDMLVPDNDDGTIGSGNVTGTFGVKACRGDDWMAMITIDPFQVAGLEGWGWNASNAWLDFSDTENPPDFHLPAGYGDTTRTDSRLVNTWQGFFMERIEVRLPPAFASTTAADRRTTFGAYNTIIDGTGLSVSIQARNILEVSEGNFEGWGFAIDTLNVDFVSNTFTNAGMAGRISMPIFEAGDNLKYRMVLGFDDGSDEFSYQFAVYTRDTLNIPMWGAARMFFKPNSSIEIGLNDPEKGDHITANLNGGIHLVGDFGSIPMLNFRGINFEGLYLSTHADENGRYFHADSIYFAHASPQKSASGFPVSIENINLNINNITRPGVEFDIILNFSEGSTAIGASATFGVFATFQKVGDNFEVGFGGVDVGAIGIDVEVSVMKLQGELEFYKDDPVYGNGTRGTISVQLPMDISGRLTAYFGTFGNASRGAFGTANYYAYWLVDGMITFPGIPIFSGFAIYGFGGGAYHHMTMDPATRLPNPQATMGSDGARTAVRYIPTFDVGLGLKFTAVFGTHPSNQAFNMDVSLAAEFNSSYGLNFISVSGAGYFMAGLTERGDAKVWANVEIMFDNRPAEGPKFTGNFDVFVNVGSFLHGSGAGNKFVSLELYFDANTWHIYLGTPDDRAGLTADVQIITAQLTSYLMVGHGIPVALPPLPDRVQAVLYGSSQLEGSSSTSSAASSRERNPSDDAAYRSGQGFAFGTALAIPSIEFNFAIFYATLGLDFGFDLNFMKPAPGSVFCVETGAPPRGIDGWYIQGQIFAGLYGEMGVQVDLMFIKGRFPFIQLGAAAVLQGNFPDPTGFRGRAGLYYSVLGGMVEGRCNFDLEVGQKCTMVTPNPLSGMNFIADIIPANGTADQSCFSSPAVSFNLPVERFMEFPVTAADGTEVTRTFFPYIETFSFKKTGTTTQVRGTRSFASNNTELRFRLDEMLEGRATYEVRIVVRSREHFASGPEQIVRNSDGSIWQEERTITFTTGPVPDFIPIDQVAYTYPVDGQYYYLKNESVLTGGVRKGLMQLDNPVERILATTIDGQQYKYLIRFTPVSGGDPTEYDLSYTSGRILNFNVPTLVNETMYAAQIIRKIVPRPADPLARAGASIREAQQASIGGGNSATMRVAFNQMLESGGSNVTIKTAAQPLLPGEAVEPDEKLMYKFYFRTSRYNTLQEKVNAATLSARYVNALIVEGFTINTYLAEPFDEFEVNGLYKDGNLVMKPLLSLQDPFTYSYHTTLAMPGIYNLRTDFANFVSTIPVSPIAPTRPAIATLNRHEKGYPPRLSITVASNSVVADGIEQWQIENEASRNPDYNPQAGQNAMLTAHGGIESTMSAASGAINGGSGSRGIGSFSLSSSISVTPSSNFTMTFSTSAYVWGDFTDLKNSVSRALAFQPMFLGPYIVRDALSGNTGLRNRVNTLMSQSMATYRLTHGSYGVAIQYQYPRGSSLYNNGTRSVKTFTY